MDRKANLRGPAKFILVAGTIIFAISLFMKNRLPLSQSVLDSLSKEPVQTETELPGPFDVTRKDMTYTVTPLFNYELWGLVVSYHHASSFIDISHEMWKDFINIKDICVIWGRNVETGVYRRMKFRNRDFTCFYRYPDQATKALFSENCLSNNHLLPANPLIARSIMKVRKGDQIRFKGWLVSYGIKDTPYRRVSSSTRTDRGNGACETVYVNEFQILRAANSEWRGLNKVSLVLAILCAVALLFILPAPRMR